MPNYAQCLRSADSRPSAVSRPPPLRYQRCQSKMSRSNVALAACVLSVLLGLLVIRQGYDPYKAAQYVGFAWMMIWTWLGNRFGLLGMRQKQLYETFKNERALPLPFDKTIFRGAVVLTLVSTVGWFR